MRRELGHYVERRRQELGLSRRDVAERSGLSYPYISQIETGEREPAIKAMRALAPVLGVRLDQLAGLVAGADSSDASQRTTSPAAHATRSTGQDAAAGKHDRALLAVERRLRDVPPVERLALLNQLIAQVVEELQVGSPARADDAPAPQRPVD